MANPSKSQVTFPPGPWDEEPDFKLWTDETTGYRCMVRRIGWSGYLCGYVEVPTGHGLHGADYDDSIAADLSGRKMDAETNPVDVFIHCMEERDGTARLSIALEVHGGVTFTGARCVQEDNTGGEVGHWFGFDCDHDGDLAPLSANDPTLGDGVYRDFTYVERECASLAKQLLKLAEAKVLPGGVPAEHDKEAQA